ncbi:GNAT family N-acetyltransferase [Solibacillus sp. MA9]|uniref:GNAT family N-acetyltransferase n=1 Tax=Solibacillus palustris TaxID=2908203 RepID=A0ABS9UAY9_9BACL|nr:GNAT family N-acetyltransferase [Solibacillus sp. MA9]MCH7321339.1 GNAT family N-acetyltransferase [Solibacillus sp. MA9]
MKIRQFKNEDILELTQLMTQLGYPTTSSTLQNRFEKLINSPNYHIFIAELEGEVVGFAGFMKQWAFEFDEPYVRVLALVVDEKHRRKNIGQCLMQEVDNWAGNNDCVAVTLNSGNREERKAAHQFYERLGYAAKSTGFLKKLRS